jgi:hypothetical protein
MHGNSTRENRETPSTPAAKEAAGRLEKAMSQESNMYGGGESDGCVVLSKCPNNGGQLPAEDMEGRQPTKENSGQATAPRTQSRIGELSDLLGVRKAARKDKRTRFTALLHHVTVNLLRDSYFALKRDAAPGVDGVSWQEYETELDEKLADLHGLNPSRDVSSAAFQESLHPESRWTAIAPWASQPWRIRSFSRP